jgi:hypothetical protein
MRIKDLVGRRFGRLVVQSLSGKTKAKKAIWNCLCDCGAMSQVISNNLKSGGTISCGCAQKMIAAATSTISSRKHGHRRGKKRTRTYRSWMNMRARCNNPNAEAYRYYGAQGIKVCPRWNSFENFLADMGERPEGRTIDRKDPFGWYTPKNCRWATREMQNANRRRHWFVPKAA